MYKRRRTLLWASLVFTLLLGLTARYSSEGESWQVDWYLSAPRAAGYRTGEWRTDLDVVFFWLPRPVGYVGFRTGVVEPGESDARRFFITEYGGRTCPVPYLDQVNRR